MKNFIVASLAVAGFMSSAAFAASSGTPRLDATLVDGWLEVAPVTREINLAQTGTLTARNGRAGFVKNNFDFTVSANVAAGVNDDGTRSRFGVIAGSNKGYNVFTGSSVGGSISQCGAQLTDKSIANLGASLVTNANLVLNNANGCGRSL
jgi:opacity protein-like surface antigen